VPSLTTPTLYLLVFGIAITAALRVLKYLFAAGGRWNHWSFESQATRLSAVVAIYCFVALPLFLAQGQSLNKAIVGSAAGTVTIFIFLRFIYVPWRRRKLRRQRTRD
jgi:hypothetical protein